MSAEKPYKHQSMFWSDLGTVVGYEAIGLVDSSLPTASVFARRDTNDETRLPYGEKSTEITSEKPSVIKTDKVPSTVLITDDATAQSPLATATIKDCPPAGTKTEPHDFGKGVVFYLDGDKIVGILLWNVFNRISIARKILMSEETFTDLNEVAKLFDIFEQHHEDK